MYKLLKTTLAASLGLLAIGPAANAATTYTFNSALTGSQSWTTTTNWSPTGNPGSAGSYTDVATIAPVSGALNVTTPGSATTIGLINLTGSAGNALTLTLGNDLIIDTIHTAAARSTFNNTSGVASNLVLDLNGYNFTAITTSGGNNYGFAILMGSGLSMNITSNSGGTFTNDGWGASFTGPFVNLQGNATARVQLGGAYTVYANNTTFSSGSTFVVAGGGASAGASTVALYAKATTPFGNLVLGDTVNSAHYTDVVMQTAAGGQTATIAGNLSLLGGKTNMYLGYNSSSYFKALKIAGNFTDEGGSVSGYNKTGGTPSNSTISFTGGAGTEHTVSVNRNLGVISGTVTNFEVGDGTTAGNIKLVNPSATVGALYMAGSMTVYAGSRLNLDHSTTTGNVASLRAGSIIVGTGATIGVTFGDHSGYAVADATLGGTGNLTLNTFNLELNYSGSGWVDGSDLLLFHFTGSLTGTPTLGTVSVTGYNYGGLFYDNLTKNVYLTGLTAVPVPEPGSA
ncbi:MAG: hypothetical protein ABI615_01210, partial [Chthoniobacterales bacterium]